MSPGATSRAASSPCIAPAERDDPGRRPGIAGAPVGAEHGYDTKYALHALRRGFQGIDLLTTGRISLPIREPDRSFLRSVRHGELPLPEVLDGVADVEQRLVALQTSSAVPPEPDRVWVDDWLHRSYLSFWNTLS
jgi:hypothetical protein